MVRGSQHNLVRVEFVLGLSAFVFWPRLCDEWFLSTLSCEQCMLLGGLKLDFHVNASELDVGSFQLFSCVVWLPSSVFQSLRVSDEVTFGRQTVETFRLRSQGQIGEGGKLSRLLSAAVGYFHVSCRVKPLPVIVWLMA